MALAQRHFIRVRILRGIGRRRRDAYFIGYNDIVLTIFKWALSGTGFGADRQCAQYYEAVFFKCPRCDGIISGARRAGSSRSNAALRLAAQFAGGRGLDPVNFPPTPRPTSQRENRA